MNTLNKMIDFNLSTETLQNYYTKIDENYCCWFGIFWLFNIKSVWPHFSVSLVLIFSNKVSGTRGVMFRA